MAVTRPLPQWHPGSFAYIDNCFRARIKVNYAVRVHRFVQEEKRRLMEEERHEVHRFLDDFTDGDGDCSSVDDDDFFDCESSIESNASVVDHLNDAANRVWKVPSLRKEQSACLERILFHDSSRGKVLNIAPTGSGKSLTLRMVGTFTAGISIVFVPLLALTADQMAAIKKAVQKHASFEAHHMDEIPSSSNALEETIVPRMLEILSDSSSTMYLFTSPQYVVDHPIFLRTLLKCHERRTLRFVAIDEAHLYAMHGKTFRECIRLLQTSFFERVFGLEVDHHPLFMVMTATMTSTILPCLSTLTSVDWESNEHQMWAPHEDFKQRNVQIDFEVTGDIGQVALPRLVEKLKNKASAYVCLFVNFRSETDKWAKVLENLLASSAVPVDVLQINGDMDKLEKFAFIKLFTNATRMRNFWPRALAATAAANTGINQTRVEEVSRVGLPRDLQTACQEKGRNARKEGMSGAYRMFSDWRMFIKLLLSIVIPLTSVSKEIPEYEGLNSLIVSKSPVKRPVHQKESSIASPSAPLSKTARHNNIVDGYNDLVKVTNMFCLPGLGCVHARLEWFMGSIAKGNMDVPLPNNLIAPCKTQCYVCNGKYKK